jgi:hypothetical protein
LQRTLEIGCGKKSYQNFPRHLPRNSGPQNGSHIISTVKLTHYHSVALDCLRGRLIDLQELLEEIESMKLMVG